MSREFDALLDWLERREAELIALRHASIVRRLPRGARVANYHDDALPPEDRGT